MAKNEYIYKYRRTGVGGFPKRRGPMFETLFCYPPGPPLMQGGACSPSRTAHSQQAANHANSHWAAGSSAISTRHIL